MKTKILAAAVFLLASVLSVGAAQPGPEALYLQGKFEKTVETLEAKDASRLTTHERCLLAECRARTGRKAVAEKTVTALLAGGPAGEEALRTAGTVYQFAGDFQRASAFYARAMAAGRKDALLWLGLATLRLDLRDPEGAIDAWKKAGDLSPALAAGALYRRVGYAVYDPSACRAPERIAGFYRSAARHLESAGKTSAAKDLQALGDLYDKASGPLFAGATDSDRVELTMVDFRPDAPYKCLVLHVGGKAYKVLLDTGNAPGWTVHNPALIDGLPTVKGAECKVRTGSVKKALKSFRLLTRRVDFGGLVVHNLVGSYFAKPRPSYFDANLNPYFIRDHVVTMDFVHNRFIVRTKARFDADMARERARITRVPCFAFRWCFVPAALDGPVRAMVHIETGAEDISLEKAFAIAARLPLTPKVRHWRDGKDYPYEVTPLTLLIGTEVFHRPEAEVWPEGFNDPVAGKFSDVMLGPLALEGRYAISFDPFDNEVVLEGPAKAAPPVSPQGG